MPLTMGGQHPWSARWHSGGAFPGGRDTRTSEVTPKPLLGKPPGCHCQGVNPTPAAAVTLGKSLNLSEPRFFLGHQVTDPPQGVRFEYDNGYKLSSATGLGRPTRQRLPCGDGAPSLQANPPLPVREPLRALPTLPDGGLRGDGSGHSRRHSAHLLSQSPC